MVSSKSVVVYYWVRHPAMTRYSYRHRTVAVVETTIAVTSHPFHPLLSFSILYPSQVLSMPFHSSCTLPYYSCLLWPENTGSRTLNPTHSKRRQRLMPRKVLIELPRSHFSCPSDEIQSWYADLLCASVRQEHNTKYSHSQTDSEQYTCGLRSTKFLLCVLRDGMVRTGSG